MIPIVVMASGGGSGFESIADAIALGEVQAEIKALFCDQPKAGVIEKAQARGIKTIVLAKEVGESRESYDQRMLSLIMPFEPRFIVMAGFMRVLSRRTLDQFRSERGYTRVVNIHPSILPAFPGVGAYAQAFEHGARLAGATVHLVELEVDSGPICAQAAFNIEEMKSAQDVETQGKEIEHRLYPKALSWILPERFEVEIRDKLKGRLCVRPN